MKLVHQNIRGLLSKIDCVEVFIDSENPDIICLTEHYLKSAEFDILKLAGFHSITAYCRSHTKGGGVCILMKENITYQRIDVAEFSEENICELAAAVIDPEGVNILTIAGYRPPGNRSDQFYRLLSGCLDKYVRANRKIIVVGDFNIDLSKTTHTALQFRTIMESYGLHNTVKSYTRECKESKSLLDPVFTNINNDMFNCYVVISALSDHHAQIAYVNTSLNKVADNVKTKTRFSRQFTDESKEQFSKLINIETWRDMYDSIDVNDKYEAFHNQLQYIFNLAFPKKIIKVNKLVDNAKVILDDETLRVRDLMYQLYVKTKDLDSRHYMRHYYKRIKYKYRHLIRQIKSAKIHDTINKANNKTKAIWGTIQDNKNNRTKKKRVLCLVNDKGELIKDPNLIANEFNSFFIDVGKISERQRQPMNLTNKILANSMFLYPTTVAEVEGTIQSLKSKKSVGSDGISSMLIKEFYNIFSIPLTHIINASFENGTFPERLKISVVKPIHKKGSERCCENYRPITLVSSISKIFEKIFFNRLTEFLCKNNIIYENQYGFMKGKNTTDAIYALTSKIIEDLDKKNHCLGLFFDLSKAFDTVNHDLLLERLYSIGIRGLALEWITSYITGRRQYVEVLAADDSGHMRPYSSAVSTVVAGVPQGSVLGPVLFVIFINNIHKCIQRGNICLFADDTSLSVSGASKGDLELNAFLDANSLLQWFDSNKLSLNFQKTQLLPFNIRNKFSNDSIEPAILLGDQFLETTSHVKFLGLLLDRNLNFHKHIDSVCKKMSGGIFLLRRMSPIVDRSVLLTAYYGVIYPFMAYAVPIWGGDSSKTLFLFKMQKRAIRVIFGLYKQQSCRETFINSHILTFPSIYILETLSFIKRNPQLTSSNNTQHYKLRNNLNINIPHHYTSFFKKHLLYNGIQLFNALPNKLKLESDLLKFKRQLKNILLAKCYYSVRECIADGFLLGATTH